MYRISLENDLDALQGKLMALKERSLPYAIANAMTGTAQQAKRTLQERLPRYIDRPRPATINAVFTYPKRVSPQQLEVELGLADYQARRIGAIFTGGPRPAKRSEQQLRNRGIIPGGAFIVPTGVRPRLDRFGGLRGGDVTAMLSRVRGFGFGNEYANRSDSKRSKAARRQTDYFAAVMPTAKGRKLAIYARAGRKQRGYVTAFYVISQAPSYRKQVPAQTILSDAFRTHFQYELAKAIRNERAVYAQRAAQGRS
jgi:hypothetical protein